MSGNKIATFYLSRYLVPAALGNTPNAYNEVWHLPTDPQRLTGKQWIELFAGKMDRPAKYSLITKGMLAGLGLFLPIMHEFKEMLYQYDQDYFFDSSKFNTRFQFETTTYEKGVEEVIKAGI